VCGVCVCGVCVCVCMEGCFDNCVGVCVCVCFDSCVVFDILSAVHRDKLL